MPDLLEGINVSNAGSSYDFPIPREVGKSEYTTRTQDNPRLNEEYLYTRIGSLPRYKIVFYTTILKEELDLTDLAPGLTIKQAANITRKFINKLPKGLMDADLGPGI